MKRQRKKYEKPTKPWDKQRLEAEREILEKFGLKTKKELWRVEGLLRKYRRLARNLAAKKNKEEETAVIRKLIELGILPEGSTLDNVLGITLEDFLNRRLQTVLLTKNLVNTAHQARQLIVHGHVKIGSRKVRYPSYLVAKKEENNLQVTIPVQVKKVATASTEPVVR